jgi:hypothetical protein
MGESTARKYGKSEMAEVLHSEFTGSNLFARFEIFLRSRKTLQELTGEPKTLRSRYVPVRRNFAVIRAQPPTSLARSASLENLDLGIKRRCNLEP